MQPLQFSIVNDLPLLRIGGRVLSLVLSDFCKRLLFATIPTPIVPYLATSYFIISVLPVCFGIEYVSY